MRLSWILLLGTLCPVLAGQKARPLPADRETGAATITEADMRGWLTTLASPAFGGRGTGQDGFRKAATLVRDHFKHLGLKPMGDDGGYWQRLPWTRVVASAKTHLTVSHGKRRVLELRSGAGLSGRLATPLEVHGKPVLIVLHELDGAGLADLELEDRLVFLYAPDGFGAGRGSFRAQRRLVSRLREARPLAWVLVDDARAKNELAGGSRPGRSRSGNRRPPRYAAGNQLYTTTAALDTILQAAGKSRAALPDDAFLVELGDLDAELMLASKTEQAPAYNVIAALPGSDPVLKNEYVVIGSHLDHLGTRGGTIYPGADDDGSGTTGVLAISRAFARNQVRPRRSILFVTFCGEEMGLLGSKWFVEHPPIPLSAIATELQMDMIGRDEERGSETAAENLNSLHLIGTKKLAPALHQLCLARNHEFAAFDLEWDEENVFYRSDHWSFAKYGVPIAFFFTGFHPDYHRPTDTVEKIDFPKLRRVASYVFDLAFELAQADQRPRVDPTLWQALRNKASRTPAAPLLPQHR